ncbi:MAG: DUF4159 domain-containing protein [Pirellulales bacterium]
MKRLLFAMLVFTMLAVTFFALPASGQEPDDIPTPPDWLRVYQFKQETFTFVRLRYNQVPQRVGGRFLRANSWQTDYPDAELQFGAHLAQVLPLNVTDPVILTITDERLPGHPFAYMVEPGRVELTDAEVPALRNYLQGGGFLMVDDFWGEAELASFMAQMKRVFPDRQSEKLALDHPIFHCVYELKVRPQVVSIHTFLQPGRETEFEGADPADYRAIFDDNKRMMVLICHNTDLADGWERQSVSPEYTREMSQKLALPMGTNIVFYALTQQAE